MQSYIPTLMPSASIICISDSRGRGTCKYLREKGDLPQNTHVSEASVGGADFHALFREIRHRTRDITKKYPSNQITIILQGGICHLTTKARNTGEIYYDPPARVIQEIKETITTIINYTKERQYKLVIATIIPANLQASFNFLQNKKRTITSRYTDNQRGEQQQKLEKDITEINNFIEEVCKKDNVTKLNFYKQVTKTSKKKRKREQDKTKTHYTDLYDGVHPNSQLKETLLNKIKGACKYIRSKEQEQQEEGSSQDSEPDNRKWDFKRRRTESKP